MTKAIPVIAVLASGPAEGGGIGRFWRYLARANEELDLIDIKATLDPRGPQHWSGSLWRTPRSALSLIVLRLRYGARPIVHVHIAGRLSTARKLVVITMARLLGFKVVVHYHEFGYTRFLSSLPPMARAMTRSVLRRCEGHIVLGDKEAEILPRELHCERERFHVIHTCAPRDLTQIEPLRIPSPIGIVFVGALSSRKGVNDLLQAVAGLPRENLPAWRLTFCGSGDLEAHRQYATQLGVGEQCVFLGHVDEAAVRAQLLQNHIFCLPSHAEGLSVALLESMAMSCAVVATPVGEHESVLKHESNALVVTPGDVASLRDALQRLISDPTLRDRLAANARRSILNGFTSDYALRKVSEAFTKTLAR